jgi:hypothetical protein
MDRALVQLCAAIKNQMQRGLVPSPAAISQIKLICYANLVFENSGFLLNMLLT